MLVTSPEDLARLRRYVLERSNRAAAGDAATQNAIVTPGEHIRARRLMSPPA